MAADHRHLRLRGELGHGVVDRVRGGGDDDRRGSPRRLQPLQHPDQQRLAGQGHQDLARQPGRAGAGLDDDENLLKGPVSNRSADSGPSGGRGSPATRSGAPRADATGHAPAAGVLEGDAQLRLRRADGLPAEGGDGGRWHRGGPRRLRRAGGRGPAVSSTRAESPRAGRARGDDGPPPGSPGGAGRASAASEDRPRGPGRARGPPGTGSAVGVGRRGSAERRTDLGSLRPAAVSTGTALERPVQRILGQRLGHATSPAAAPRRHAASAVPPRRRTACGWPSPSPPDDRRPRRSSAPPAPGPWRTRREIAPARRRSLEAAPCPGRPPAAPPVHQPPTDYRSMRTPQVFGDHFLEVGERPTERRRSARQPRSGARG